MIVECVCGATPVANAMQAMKLVGIINDRDIVCRAMANGKYPLDLTVVGVMGSSGVNTVTPETSFDVCCKMMEQD